MWSEYLRTWCPVQLVSMTGSGIGCVIFFFFVSLTFKSNLLLLFTITFPPTQISLVKAESKLYLHVDGKHVTQTQVPKIKKALARVHLGGIPEGQNSCLKIEGVVSYSSFLNKTKKIQ